MQNLLHTTERGMWSSPESWSHVWMQAWPWIADNSQYVCQKQHQILHFHLNPAARWRLDRWSRSNVLAMALASTLSSQKTLKLPLPTRPPMDIVVSELSFQGERSNLLSIWLGVCLNAKQRKVTWSDKMSHYLSYSSSHAHLNTHKTPLLRAELDINYF